MSIKVSDIFFSYPDKEIFKGFSKDFNAGVFYSLTAPSGGGKTTLFRLIAGLEKQSSGEIHVSGKTVYMFQEDRLFPTLTVLENVEIASTGDVSPEFVLKELGLFEERNSYPSELSGGMRRRVALARALISNGDNLLLDEPFTGLDDATKKKCMALIKKLCSDKTVIVATHDEEEKKLCTEHITI